MPFTIYKMSIQVNSRMPLFSLKNFKLYFQNSYLNYKFVRNLLTFTSKNKLKILIITTRSMRECEFTLTRTFLYMNRIYNSVLIWENLYFGIFYVLSFYSGFNAKYCLFFHLLASNLNENRVNKS